MKRIFRLLRFFASQSDNLKPVLNEVEGSKTCPELCRRIENPKWVGIFAIALTFAFGGAVATAQQAKKVTRIGYLATYDAATESTRSEAIRLAAMWMSITNTRMLS